MPNQSSSSDWRRPRPNLLATMFKPGTTVRHLSPHVDWTGRVITEDTGIYLRVRDVRLSGGGPITAVYIEWSHGTAQRTWTDVDAIEVIDEPAQAVTA